MAIQDEDRRKPRSHAPRVFRDHERTVWIGAFMVPERLVMRVKRLLTERQSRHEKATEPRPKR